MERIAIFGGSFNPPGMQHCQIAEKLVQKFDLVVVTPCGIRSDKASTNVILLEHRREMVKLAFGEFFEGKMEIDFYDLENNIFTPTYLLESRYQNRFPDSQIWHVVGGDIIAGGRDKNSEIHWVWQQGEKIWQEFHFVIIVRPGYQLASEDMPPLSELIEIKNLFGSGTMIREHTQKGEPIDELAVPKVKDYIFRNKLYCVNKSKVLDDNFLKKKGRKNMTEISELKIVYDQIIQAVSPEDIFGKLDDQIEKSEKLKSIKRIYRRITRVIHEDVCPDFKEMAHDAFVKLQALYKKAEEKIENGTYGIPTNEADQDGRQGFGIETRKRKYYRSLAK
jgi:nicotinate (nicotinamide) nucleotide adenylyltransferase